MFFTGSRTVQVEQDGQFSKLDTLAINQVSTWLLSDLRRYLSKSHHGCRHGSEPRWLLTSPSHRVVGRDQLRCPGLARFALQCERGRRGEKANEETKIMGSGTTNAEDESPSTVSIDQNWSVTQSITDESTESEPRRKMKKSSAGLREFFGTVKPLNHLGNANARRWKSLKVKSMKLSCRISVSRNACWPSSMKSFCSPNK